MYILSFTDLKYPSFSFQPWKKSMLSLRPETWTWCFHLLFEIQHIKRHNMKFYKLTDNNLQRFTNDVAVLCQKFFVNTSGPSWFEQWYFFPNEAKLWNSWKSVSDCKVYRKQHKTPTNQQLPAKYSFKVCTEFNNNMCIYYNLITFL